MPPVKPIPGKGLTVEAAEALGVPQDQSGGTSSETADFPSVSTYSDLLAGSAVDVSSLDAGDIIDAEIVPDIPEMVTVKPEPRARRSPTANKTSKTPKAPEKPVAKTSEKPLVDPEKPARDPTSGIPNIDEWMDFFSRIVLRYLMEWYVDYVFRGVDENIIDAHDIERLRVRKEERDAIARPFAEYSTKNKFMRKHGREIVALADSIESLVVLGTWVSRVNRIAHKYKPQSQQKQQKRQTTTITPEVSQNGSVGPNQGYIQGADGGIIADGFSIYNPGGS